MRPVLLAVFMLSVGTAAPASADIIRITDGRINFDSGDPFTFLLFGAGFSAAGENFGEDTFVTITPPNAAAACLRCIPGESVTLGAEFTFRSDGLSPIEPFPGEGRRVFFDGVFSFVSGSTAVPAEDSWLEDTFLFSGQLVGYADESRTGTPLFSHQLLGRGRVAILLQHSARRGGMQAFDVNYFFDDVAAVPEPSTLVLFGVGAAVAVRRARRRR
jgi:hypothetical protein